MLTQQRDFISVEAKSTTGNGLFLGVRTGKKGKGLRDGQSDVFPFRIYF